jgi:hypothetical protein
MTLPKYAILGEVAHVRFADTIIAGDLSLRQDPMVRGKYNSLRLPTLIWVCSKWVETLRVSAC